MHILFIPSSFPDENNPIRGVFYLKQAEVLKKFGLKIGVICPDLKAAKDIFKFSALRSIGRKNTYSKNGVKCYRSSGINIFPGLRRLQEWHFSQKALKLFKEYCKDYGKPDLIHVQTAMWAGGTALRIFKKMGIPYVVTEHSTYVLAGKYSKWERDYLEKVYDNSIGIIAVGKRLMNAVNDITRKEVRVIPNVVDISQFTPSKKRDPLELVVINALNKRKRVDTLLESLALIKKNYNEVKLHIVGGGSERKNLESIVNRLNLVDNVIFHGVIENAKINELLEGKGILVSSSERETFGVTLIEAMAKGIPVVSTKSGGPEDIVTEKCGILCEVGDSKQFAKAIIQVHDDYDRYNKEDIISDVSERYGERNFFERLNQFYQEAL